MIQPINSLNFKGIYKQPGGRFTDKEFELINDVYEKMNTTNLKETKGSRFIDFLDSRNYHLFVKPGTIKDSINISLSEGISFTSEGIKLLNEKEVGTFGEGKEFLPEYVKDVYNREQARKSFNAMGIIGTIFIAAAIITGAIITLKKEILKLNTPETKEIVIDSLKTMQKDTLDLSKKIIK